MRPIAGRMRLKTSASGIFSTNRNRPVSTNMLTRILVPKPKKAFQSPGAHKIGRKPAVDVVVVIARSSSWRACLDKPEHGRQTVDRRLPLPQFVPAPDRRSNPIAQRFVANRDEASARAAGGWKIDALSSANDRRKNSASRRWLCEKSPSGCGTILASVVPIMTTSRLPLNGEE